MLNINARLAFKIIHEFGVLVLGEMRKGNGEGTNLNGRFVKPFCLIH